MHGVGRRDDVDAPGEELGAEHLVEALEPSLVAEEAEQAQRNSVVVAELLERDPQELR